METYIKIMNKQLVNIRADVEFLRRQHGELTRCLREYHTVISQNQKVFFLKKLINQTYIQLKEEQDKSAGLLCSIAAQCSELMSYRVDFSVMDRVLVDLQLVLQEAARSV